MKPLVDLDALAFTRLQELVVALLGEVGTLTETIGELRAEIVRLKSLKGPPNIKPSGLDKASDAAKSARGSNSEHMLKVAARWDHGSRATKTRVMGFSWNHCPD